MQQLREKTVPLRQAFNKGRKSIVSIVILGITYALTAIGKV